MSFCNAVKRDSSSWIVKTNTLQADKELQKNGLEGLIVKRGISGKGNAIIPEELWKRFIPGRESTYHKKLL
jgi:hypothetical protein